MSLRKKNKKNILESEIDKFRILKDWNNALNSIKKYIKLDQNFIIMEWIITGEYYLDLKSFEQAKEYLQKAFEKDSHNDVFLYYFFIYLFIIGSFIFIRKIRI